MPSLPVSAGVPGTLTCQVVLLTFTFWETGEEQPIRGTLILSHLFVKKKFPDSRRFHCEKACALGIEKVGFPTRQKGGLGPNSFPKA